MPGEFNEREAEEFILNLLRDGNAYTTREIEEAASESSMNCPDELIRFLSRMKARRLISGKLSPERKGWVWYVDRKEDGGEG